MSRKFVCIAYLLFFFSCLAQGEPLIRIIDPDYGVERTLTEIGSGGFGTAYEYRADGAFRVVKLFSEYDFTLRQQIANYERVNKITADLGEPSPLVHYEPRQAQIYNEGRRIWQRRSVVFSEKFKGDLENLLMQLPPPETEQGALQRISLSKDIATSLTRAVLIFAKSGFVHGDIHSKNVFYSRDKDNVTLHFKLADYDFVEEIEGPYRPTEAGLAVLAELLEMRKPRLRASPWKDLRRVALLVNKVLHYGFLTESQGNPDVVLSKFANQSGQDMVASLEFANLFRKAGNRVFASESYLAFRSTLPDFNDIEELAVIQSPARADVVDKDPNFSLLKYCGDLGRRLYYYGYK